MNAQGRVTRLVTGIAVVALLSGCASGATSAPPSAQGAATIAATASASSPPPPAATATPAATPAPSSSSRSAWDPPNDAALPDATVSKLQAQLDGWVSGGEVIGLSAAVVSPEGSWAGAAGVDAAGTAVKPTSAFAIASVTKTFVAAEVLLLASLGKIDLDAPVTNYVTLPFETNGATIRQLATMTSGFP
ncbi:MAG: serine hydrolase, partial [Candidatus Limnocylindrales bacterium]